MKIESEKEKKRQLNLIVTRTDVKGDEQIRKLRSGRYYLDPEVTIWMINPFSQYPIKDETLKNARHPILPKRDISLRS